MARDCFYDLRGRSGRATWLLKGEFLLTPENAPPVAFGLGEVSGIAGDGFNIDMGLGGEKLCLRKLGGEGPVLLDSLVRTWLPLRAEALRLTGTGEARRFSGRLSTWGDPRLFSALLFEDILLLAPEGEDVRPVFLSLLSGIERDEAACALTCRGWWGESWLFSKLAGRLDEFHGALLGARSALAAQSAALLARRVPSLAPGARAALSGIWGPGRFLSLPEIESACPGFTRAFSSTWLAGLPRRSEGEIMLRESGADAFLGFSRPGKCPAGSGEYGPAREGEDGPAGGCPEAGGSCPEGAGGPEEILWLLAAVGGRWFLEALSEADHATYRFESGPDLVGLASCLISAPQFSKEALYLPLDSLAGDRAGLSAAARDLSFLKELRARFRGRIIHTSLESWKRELRA